MELTDQEWSLIANALRAYAAECEGYAKANPEELFWPPIAKRARALGVRIETEQGV